nr:zinc dependent phospholipase C family protein [Peptoniphilus catoniae]
MARNIHDNILNKYDVDLNIDKLQWGAIAPDVLPYYKLIRHYKEESIDYIAKEIVSLIYLCRYADLHGDKDSLLLKYLSKKIGIISHYLCDYNCYPHAYRMTFINSMKSHIKYESDLGIYAENHEFAEINWDIAKLNIYNNGKKSLQTRIKTYINDAVDCYMKAPKGFSTDLDYALKLSGDIAYFIIETILEYSVELQFQFI